MHFSSLLSLPPAIILLLCATSSVAEPGWPHNLPKHMKYFPEEEAHIKRGLDVRERMHNEKPIGVKKMSLDEGEMFMLDNWIFASDVENDRKSLESRTSSNETVQPISPLRPLAEEEWFGRFRVRDALMKRQFKCPSGTNDCSSIGAPDVCCGSGSDCVTVPDTSVGSVGCCPKGQMCAGAVTCDEANGYTSCPDAPNGGCCLPGFRCDGIGCVAAGTSAIYVLPSTSARPSTSAQPTTSAGAVAPTTPSTSATPTSTQFSTSASAYTCSTGWFSCPVSLGGGCCQNGRECASGASCIGDDPTSTQAPVAPVRPTSQALTTSTSNGDDVCPGGFYVCSAYYPSGCCRVGRDCQTTGSCIVPSSTTVIETNGVTIVAPSGASVATAGPEQGGSCPSSWYSCPADRGGSCCPEGFACGEQCTATASGVSSVQAKVAPSTASFVSQWSVWGMVSAAFAAGVAMIAL